MLLQRGQDAVFQFRRFVEVVAALGLFHLQLHPFDLFLERRQLIDCALLLLPLGVQGTLLFAQFCKFPFDPLQPFLAGTVGFAAQGELLHLQLQDLAIDFIDLLRFGGDLHLQARG